MLRIGIPALRIISLSFPIAGFCIGCGSVFQALGYSVYSMIVSLVRQLFVLIPCAFLIGRLTGNVTMIWWAFVVAELFSLLLSCGMYFTRGFTIVLFNDDPGVIAQGMQIVAYLAFCYPLFTCTEVFSSAMRGVGDAVRPTLLTLLGICVLRMIILFIVTIPHPSNITIALCYPVTWAVSSLMFLIYYKFGNWLPAWKEKA